MKKIVLALAVIFFGHSVYSQHTDALLSSYFNVKNALVSGNGKAASEGIASFSQALEAGAAFSQKAALLKAAEKLNKAGNSLERQRAAFNDVSTLMWKLVKDSDDVDQSVYYQYCPMKKTYWLSEDKEIKNPYYGSSMLTCGKVTETKN